MNHFYTKLKHYIKSIINRHLGIFPTELEEMPMLCVVVN